MKKELIRLIADNPELFEEVKKVFLSEFDFNEIKLTTNEDMGQITRAIIDGKGRLEKVFKKILECRTNKPKEEIENPAR